MSETEARQLAREALEEVHQELNQQLRERNHLSPQAAGPALSQAGREQGTQSGSTSELNLPALEQLVRQKQELESHLEAIKSDYDRIHAPVAVMADELAGELKNYLRETTRPKYARPLRDSGAKLDMRAAMASQATYERTGTYDPEVWINRTHPNKRGQKFLFLLDESGSMGGEKWQAALKALVMGMEALESLDIDFGVMGFSDRPVIHKQIQENFDLSNRKTILSSIQGSPKNGTNDADALEMGMENLLLASEPEDELFIIVITDGIGKSEQVKRLQQRAREQQIHILGVGVGEGMQPVADVYEDHALVPDLAQLPYELSEIIRQKIERDED
ncbi:VWA domain-containing protein [bacterium]|nr:VWA domain-containing protein [bacterium]